jgi:glycosyltransferase involved in cell wall biosynthesis
MPACADAPLTFPLRARRAKHPPILSLASMSRLTTSCLINNYNYRGYVGEAIESALSQAVPFDQIVVVDDGSTDGSLELLKSHYQRHPRIEIVGKQNEGQLSCFNEGFARATGDVIFFLDADDIYEPPYTARALELYHRDSRCDFVACGRRFFGHSDKVQDLFPDERDLGYSIVLTAFRRIWVGGGPTSCMSVRRRVLEKILPLPFLGDWRTCADECLVFATSLAGARKRYLSGPLVRYRVHDHNHYCGRKTEPTAAFGRALAINRLCEYLERKFDYNVARFAEFAHIEFETIEKPNLLQLRRYARIAMTAEASLVRRLSAVKTILQHYRRQAKRKPASAEGTTADHAQRRLAA